MNAPISSDAGPPATAENLIAVPAKSGWPTRPTQEWLLLLTLASVQFTVAVDFVIMMPLGPQLMHVFNINTAAFNFAVSAYAGAAGLSGLGAAFILDRFDRKQVLLVIYAGFAIGTLLCALAPGYHALVLARALAGAFGGIVGGISLSIVGDLIPPERRASAMGTVMSAFSLAQVAGVPLGLYLANAVSWHTPFFLLAGLGALVWLAAFRWLPQVRTHLTPQHQSDLRRFSQILASRNHLRAFALMAVLTLGGFMIVTDLATYLVHNVQLNPAELRWVYFAGGCATLFTMNGVGRLADRFGQKRLFLIMMIASIGTALIITHLAALPFSVVVTVTTSFMICMTGRFVPAMALITSSVAPAYRGGFMSVSSSVAQFGSALAAIFAGLIIHDDASWRLQGFGTVGWIYVCWAVVAIWLAIRLQPAAPEPATH